MSRGKHQRKKQAEQRRTEEEELYLEERKKVEEQWDAMRKCLAASTVPVLDSSKVAPLVRKSMMQNRSVTVTPELVDEVVSLVKDQYRGYGDTKWMLGIIECNPESVRWIRKETR